MVESDLYEQIIEAAHANYGSHPGHRALHAKGTWTRGTFTAGVELAALTRAAPLQGDPVPALVRFSNASGDPEANDAERDGRGMAVKLRGGDSETDILATTSPTFATRTPDDFLELLRLRAPDPATGQPDMEGLGAFLTAHPETIPAAQAIVNREPLESFASARYFSPHAFGLSDGAASTTWVRWRWEPDAGERRIGDGEARERGRDYLHDDLAERLRAGVIGFELQLQRATEEDPLDDPTAVWPDDRELLSGGRLELGELVDDPEGDGHIEVFDPTRVSDGIELSDDPILRARPRAYSVSAYRRLG